MRVRMVQIVGGFRAALRGLNKPTLIASFALFLVAVPLVSAEQADREKAVQMTKSAVKLFDEGDTDRAITAVREALVVSADYAEAHDQLGYMLLQKRQFDDAIASFNEALRLTPTMRTSKTGIGLVQYGKGDAASAEATLKNALLLNPYPAMTHYALGLVYLRMNDDEKAAFHFREGIRTFKEGKR